MSANGGKVLQEVFKGEKRPSMVYKNSNKLQKSFVDSLRRCISQDYKGELEFLGSKLATLCYCCAFLSFGMSEAIIGPTVLELGCRTNRGVTKIAWIVFVQAFSAWFGSLTGGILAERLNCNRVLLVNVLAISVCLAFIPVWTNYIGMLMAVGLLGINMGIIDTVANVNLIKIHGREVAPRLQALHFCYGVGALLSPMIVRPFLRDSCEGTTVILNNSAKSVIDRSRTILNTTTVQRTLKEPITVQFGYWITASIQIPIALALAYLVLKQKRLRENFPVPMQGEIISLSDTNSNLANEDMKDLSQIFKPVSLLPAKRSWITITVRVFLITFLSACLLFLCEGLKGSYAGYLYTFALKSKVHFSSREGAFLSALFWGHFAVGRFISIPLAIFIKPDKMVFINLVGCLVSMSVVLYFHDKALAIYIGTSLLGLFISSVFPSTLALAELYINVTGPITSVIVIGSASGEMVIPMIVGKLFIKVGPIYFLIVGLIACFLALLMYFGLRMSSNVAPEVAATSLLRNMFNTLCQYKIRKTGNGEKYSYTQLLPTFAELSSATPSCESTEQGTDESSSATIVGQSTSLTPVGSIE